MSYSNKFSEALLDFQFEVLTTYFNDGHRKPVEVNTTMLMLIYQLHTEFIKPVMDLLPLR